eukprot:TRINITY_DN1161_c0_g1_i1.p1 TRINITY_DN1161_c0_g1~~TRINITY_DN1161_c0_g1_i1.p1  ORF type:complete len:171 (+),score=34.92 TRINITY_DN1161_c0_g1_i1:255-767(+)
MGRRGGSKPKPSASKSRTPPTKKKKASPHSVPMEATVEQQRHVKQAGWLFDHVDQQEQGAVPLHELRKGLAPEGPCKSPESQRAVRTLVKLGQDDHAMITKQQFVERYTETAAEPDNTRVRPRAPKRGARWGDWLLDMVQPMVMVVVCLSVFKIVSNRMGWTIALGPTLG